MCTAGSGEGKFQRDASPQYFLAPRVLTLLRYLCSCSAVGKFVFVRTCFDRPNVNRGTMTGPRAWNGQDLRAQFQGPRPPAQLDLAPPRHSRSSCGYGCVVRGVGG